MSNRWIWALGVLLVLAAGAAFIWLQPRPSAADDGTRVLVLGLDEVEGRSRSDIIIVAQVNPDGVQLVSIPRDLRVKFPDGQLRKVNAAYSLGGVALAREVVAGFLGVELPYYAVVDYDGFETVVDLLGGVEIEVEKRMVYEDEAQGLQIDLEPGPQTLDGAQALQYVRYRDESGDLDRINRQQKLLRAVLAKESVQLEALGTVRSLLEMAFQHVESTNLLLTDLLGMAGRFQGLSAEQVAMHQLGGEPIQVAGVSYLEPNIVRAAATVDRYLRGRDVLLRSDVSVVVLNGNGASGLASQLQAGLEGWDFQVIEVGNAENFEYLNTLVIANDASTTARATLVHQALGGVGEIVPASEASDHLEAIRACGGPCRIDDPENLARADVVLIAGLDYPTEE